MALDPLEYFRADQHCPSCRKYGHWRSGQEFDHMKRCGDCEIVWIPEESYQFSMFNTRYALSLTPESVARPPVRKDSTVVAPLNTIVSESPPDMTPPPRPHAPQSIPPKPIRPPNICIEERPFSTRIVKEINVIDIPHDAKLIKKPVLPDQDQGQPLLSNWWRKLRIIPDNYAGYEVRVKYIWWPFWVQLNFSNTHPTPEAAESWARKVISPETHYI